MLFGMGVLIATLLFWTIIGLFVGIFFAAVAVLSAIRRFFVTKYIEVEKDAIVLPYGFLQAHEARLLYSEIEATREGRINSKLFGSRILTLRAGGREHSLNSMSLPSDEIYTAVRDFVVSNVKPKEKPKTAEPGLYCFQCAYEGNGAIYNSIGEVICRFRTEHFGRPRYPYGLFRTPDFVICDLEGKEVYRLKREFRPVFAKFLMSENGSRICTIKQKSVFRNSYVLEFQDAEPWTFRMPLFSAEFRGVSKSGLKVRVRVRRTHNIWYVQVDRDADKQWLVAALAFIHRERLRFN